MMLRELEGAAYLLAFAAGGALLVGRIFGQWLGERLGLAR